MTQAGYQDLVWHDAVHLDSTEAEILRDFHYKNISKWDQKIENVRFILDQAEDLSQLTTENIEYKDIVFGESVIPVQDRRVTAILNTNYLEEEIQNLAEEKQSKMGRSAPMNRLGEPKEIVAMMLMMLSPANSYLTGQCIAVDGGVSAT